MNIKKITIQWTAAIVVGFFIVNLLCFVYERPTGWIETPNGPSPAGWNPNSILVHGTEGFGIVKVDEKGYLNPEGELQEKYVLCMGSSHTQGKEILSDKKYSSLINEYFSKGEGSLAAYNIGSDGNFLPALIKHFPAAIQAFPDASVVTVEISSVDFSAEELEDALQQVNYEEWSSVVNQKQNMGLIDNLKIVIKEELPLISLVKSKIETTSVAEEAGISEKPDTERAAEAIKKAMKLIRSQYGGEIVFIYHSQTIVHQDGSIVCEYGELWDVFKKACKDNDITLLDMCPVYLEHYKNEKSLPYGFSNTKPGNGHLNELGHRLIAEELIEYIEGVMV